MSGVSKRSIMPYLYIFTRCALFTRNDCSSWSLTRLSELFVRNFRNLFLVGKYSSTSNILYVWSLCGHLKKKTVRHPGQYNLLLLHLHYTFEHYCWTTTTALLYALLTFWGLVLFRSFKPSFGYRRCGTCWPSGLHFFFIVQVL